MFNNREIAIGVWTLIFIALVIFVDRKERKIVHSLLGVAKVLFGSTIIIPLSIMIVYVGLVLGCLHFFKFWQWSDIKDTAYWFSGVALILFININNAHSERSFFRRIIRDNVKLLVVLEFVVGIYVYNIWVELLLVPIATGLGLLKAYLETRGDDPDHQYDQVLMLVNGALIAVGFIVVGRAFYGVVTDIGVNYSNLVILNNLRILVLWPLMTLALLPILYALALYMEYESIYVRLRLYNKDSRVNRSAMWRIFRTFHFNHRRVADWASRVRVLRLSTIEEIGDMLK